jgi:signal transduction histidine kinase
MTTWNTRMKESRADGLDERVRAERRARMIFVIEDDGDIRDVIDSVLGYEGYGVRAFASAVDALGSIDEGTRPDLIVLDLMMPRMDGWQFRIEQRKRPHVADVPVLVVSADASSKAAAVDADAFLRKPIDFVRLRALVAQLLTEADRRRLGAQLRETERLRALGTLVAGVAHEINNPLTFVSGSLELATRGLRSMLATDEGSDLRLDPKRVLRALEDARVGTERIASIVSTLSRFAHVEPEDPDAVDVHRVLEGAATLAAAAMRGRATLTKRYGDLPIIVGSEARLGQVFLNLLVNAAQVFPRGEGKDGNVTITTGATDDGVFVEITDDGPGIPADLAARIFEPFFTTKPAGEGTGLGLSISHDIVSSHGGMLSVHSREGEGATFRVDLPMRPACAVPSDQVIELDARPGSQSGEHLRPLPAALRARVLVVDDEPMMCMLIGRVLAAHEVVAVHRADAALDLIRGGDADFDVVFCDFSMPGMNGAGLFEAVRRTHASLAERFIFMTGTSAADDLLALERTGRKVLEKPFPLSVLTQYVESPLSCARPEESVTRALVG